MHVPDHTDEQLLARFMLGPEKALLELLRSAPHLVHKIDKDGVSPLMMACARHQENLAQALIDLGADVSLRDGGGSTALVWALKQYATKATPSRRVFELLARHGADFNDDCDGMITPLMMACECEPLDILSWLVELGADLNKVSTEDEMSVLQYACLHGHHEAAQALLKMDASSAKMCHAWLKEEMLLDPNCGDHMMENRSACLSALEASQLSSSCPLTPKLSGYVRL